MEKIYLYDCSDTYRPSVNLHIESLQNGEKIVEDFDIARLYILGNFLIWEDSDDTEPFEIHAVPIYSVLNWTITE